MGKHIEDDIRTRAEKIADTRVFIEHSRQFTARSQEFVKRLERTLMESKAKSELAELQAELDRVCAEYKKVDGGGAQKAIPLLDKILTIVARMRVLRGGK